MNNLVQMSAVIPTYNRAHIIERCIQSVLDQTHPPKEIIVVDDGSSDDTKTKLARFGDSIRFVHQSNAGAAAARNHGVQESSCEWIAFLDSDDLWTASHLERISRAIIGTSGQANFYFSDMERPTEQGGGSHWQNNSGFSIIEQYRYVDDAADWVMLDWPPMMLQSTVFKRSVYLEIGGMMKGLRTREDTHLFLRLGIGGPACAVNGIGTIHTYDADPNEHLMSIWGSQTADFWQNTVTLYLDILRHKNQLRPYQRHILQRRLAMGYWRLSRFAWKQRALGPFVQNILRCVMADPGFCLTLIPTGKKLGSTELP